MKKVDLKELSRIYTSIKDASERNDKSFPYSKERYIFKEGLKKYLKQNFGSAIDFGDENFAYIKCKYEEANIEIDFFDGIIFSVDNPVLADKIKDEFNFIFSVITNRGMTCEYDFVYYDEEKATVTKTYEWNHHPARRMYEIVNGYNYSSFGFLGGNANLVDYYHMMLIKDLGDNLLTLDGYMILFGHSYIADSNFVKHIFDLIMKIRPEIPESRLCEWYRDCYSRFSKKLY